MRELTENEKDVVRTLLQESNVDSPITIGDVLKQVYSISYIGESSYQDSPLYQESITVIMAPDSKVKNDLYEAIALIWELVERRYLIVKQLIPAKSEPIDKYIVMSMMEGPSEEFENQITIFNYSEGNLWSLLNSNFIATNALRDFAKNDKFQTVEQRRHNQSVLLAKVGIAVAIIVGAIAALLSLISILITLFEPIKFIMKSFFSLIIHAIC